MTERSFVLTYLQYTDDVAQEIKIVKRNDGVNEKTVTRIIGDKEHSIITKLVGKIVEDKEEVLNNLDPNDLDEFNEIWDYVLSQESLVGVMKWKCKDIWNKFRSCMLCTQLTEPTYRLLI